MKIYPPGEYQAAVTRVFSQVENELVQLIPDARIEHVGSSAIPGAYSKGDLDICICVEKNKFDSTLSRLESAGYAIKRNTLRTPQLCMLESARTDVSLALQLIEAGSEFEFFVTFRDALRKDAALLARFNALKLEAATFGERHYRDAKSAFIDELLGGLASHAGRLPSTTK